MSARDALEESSLPEPQAMGVTPRRVDSSADVPAPVKNPWILKKLTQVHKDAITLSMQGLSREKVAEFCGKTPAWVTLVCKQPLARAYIADLEAHADLRLRGLYEKSITAIDTALTSPKVSDRLAAAQLQLGTMGKLKPDLNEGKETAEDIVSAMLIQGNNVQVNIGRSR